MGSLDEGFDYANVLVLTAAFTGMLNGNVLFVGDCDCNLLFTASSCSIQGHCCSHYLRVHKYHWV